MTLLQVNIEDDLKKAIQKKAKAYGVSVSALVKIVLTRSFLMNDGKAGNVFNAKRDNKGKGLPVDDLIDAL